MIVFEWLFTLISTANSSLDKGVEYLNFNHLFRFFLQFLFRLIHVFLLLGLLVVFLGFTLGLALPLRLLVTYINGLIQFICHVLKNIHLLNVSSLIEHDNDNEWLGRVLDMERRLDKIVKSSQEVQMESSVNQINELKSHNKLLESKLDLLLEA